ncbi:MAG: hypothetical protein ACRD3Q_21770, partial [Terriglobales bacterium]
MPALSNVLAQLAGSLRETGAQFAPHVIEIASATTSFLATIGETLDSDIAAASYLATQLRSDEARRAAVALGISPDLIPVLSPTRGADSQLGLTLAGNAQPQARVAAAVVFSWYTLAAKAGNANRTATLQQIASAATLEGSDNSALAQTLVAELAKVPLASSQAPASCDCLFSISIDLVGSTDAKTRIMNVAKGDSRKIHGLNERIYREFCRIEQAFYHAAVHHYGAAPPIDPIKFFTVKGIGDEIWILVDAATQDVPQVGHRLIDAAIQVASRSVRFFATENDEGPSFDPDFDYGNIESIRSPIKMFIDLVSHASNLGRLRDEALVTAVPALLKTYHKRE